MFAMFGLSACSHNLSRGNVAGLLRDSAAFQKRSYFRLNTVEEITGDSQSCYDFRNRQGWQSMVNVGWATAQARMTSRVGGWVNIEYYECTLQLTTDGQRQASSWRSQSDLLGSGWDIPVAAVQLVDVTGISQAEGTPLAQVEFTYSWVPTAFGQKLGITPDGTPKAGSAELQRFDDGWRVKNTGLFGIEEPKQFSLKTPNPSSPPPSPAASTGTVQKSGFYVEVSYCHACIWSYSWQKDTVKPLMSAGLHSLTGEIANGVITRKRPTEVGDWMIPVYVGPFDSEPKARQALPGIGGVLKSVQGKGGPVEQGLEANLQIVNASVR